MVEEHVGNLISVDCGRALGVYEGRVVGVDAQRQAITLDRPIRNGIPYSLPRVTLKAADICDLRVLKLASEIDAEEASPPLDVLSILLPQRRIRTPDDPQPESEPSIQGNVAEKRKSSRRCTVSAQIQNQTQCVVADGDPRRGNRHLKDPLDSDLMRTDFDFEANLALFDKLPVKSEKGDKVSRAESEAQRKTPRNFRHDENVVKEADRVYERRRERRFVSEEGTILPGVSAEQKARVLSGFLPVEVRAEVLARAVTELILTRAPHARRVRLATEPDNPLRPPLLRYLTSRGIFPEGPGTSDAEVLVLAGPADGPEHQFNVERGVSTALTVAVDRPPWTTADCHVTTGLPLNGDYAAEEVYLVDMGIPGEAWAVHGVPNYRPPFGQKLVLKLRRV